MIREVYVGGNRILLSSLTTVGKGGEAEVFKRPPAHALKVFKTPDHEDYEGNPTEQKGAQRRIDEQQRKLRKFPKNLPPNVISPTALATDRNGTSIVGYEMRFVEGAEWLRSYADPTLHHSGLSNRNITQTFLALHRTVALLHKAQVNVADFNDLNVLVLKNEPLLIDSDSFQFGGFLTTTFTGAFVDPILCNEVNGRPNLAKPHNDNSDWYAFAAILLNSFLCCGGPYGGVYLPKGGSKKTPHDLRSLHRVSIFHPDVKYPRPALPVATLADELLHFFHMVFTKDQRGEFPFGLIEKLDWKKCNQCGLEYARRSCPVCAPSQMGQSTTTTVVKGKVTATEIFKQRSATIIFASMQSGSIRYVFHDGKQYRRENGMVVFESGLDPELRFRICDTTTLIMKGRQLFAFENGVQQLHTTVDTNKNQPACDANSKHYYWISNGLLVRSKSGGQENIGTVLTGKTPFWVGERFGFGFYQAGAMTIGFTFDAENRGINDSIQLPRIRSEVIESIAYFSGDLCWFLWSTNEQGKNYNHCALIERNGSVKAVETAEEGDVSKTWLGSIRGKCAINDKLLAATDEGLVSVGVTTGHLEVKTRFEDTEPFVDAGSSIFPGQDGLYVVGPRSINRLKLG